MEITTLDNQAVERSDAPLLVDFAGGGEPLAVCFGAYESQRRPPFEFYGRMKKLEKLTGRRVNKLLVRDVSNSWYHYGIPGVGADVAETVWRLKGVIADMAPSRVVTVGQSMGAFGAVLFGALLGADDVVAFGPLAVFDSAVSAYYSDDRWADVVKRVEANPPPVFYRDLPRLIDALGGRTRYHVFYGTKPTDDPEDKMKYVEAVNYDAVQGLLYTRSPRVAARPIRWSVHRVAAYLRRVGFIDELLRRHVLGVPFAPESLADLPINPGWVNWMDANYTAGFDGEILLPQVRHAGPLTPAVAAAAFDRVRRNVLRRKL